MSASHTRYSVRVTAITMAALLALSGASTATLALFAPGVALAQTDEEGGKKGPQYQGGTGGDHGGMTDTHGSGESGKGPQAGKGGEESDSEGLGPQHGQPTGSQGGKPAWAQEGIPEVELGRLSVIRSPDKVLDRALAEVVSNWDGSLATLYSLPAIEFGAYVEANWDTLTIIDSPLQNLALFEALLDSADHNTVPLSGVSSNLVELSAIFIGTASDKTIPVTTDTVKALLTIAGYTLPDSIVADIAAKADQVRIDILTAHG